MTVAVDFDGVIHQYSKGWQDGSIYDEPVKDSLWALSVLMQKEAVFIHTAREPEQVARWIMYKSGNSIECITRIPRDWLGRREEFWDKQGVLLVTDRKYPARLYIDDRAYRFHSWDEDLLKLLKIWS